MPASSTLNVVNAIQFAQLVNATYATQPSDLTNAAGQALRAGGINYDVIKLEIDDPKIPREIPHGNNDSRPPIPF